MLVFVGGLPLPFLKLQCIILLVTCMEIYRTIMARTLTSVRLQGRLVRRAQNTVRAKSRTQAIEMSLEAVVEAEKHRKLIKRYSGKARPGDFDRS